MTVAPLRSPFSELVKYHRGVECLSISKNLPIVRDRQSKASVRPMESPYHGTIPGYVRHMYSLVQKVWLSCMQAGHGYSAY